MHIAIGIARGKKSNINAQPMVKWAQICQELFLKYYTWTQIKVKEQSFYCRSKFHGHSKVFDNEQYSYTNMSVLLS